MSQPTEFNAFEASSQISNAYFSLCWQDKRESATKQDWKDLADKAQGVAKSIQSEMESVYTNGPKVHGRAQAVKLSNLQTLKDKTLAVMMNCEREAVKNIKH